MPNSQGQIDRSGWRVRLNNDIIDRNFASGAWKNKTVWELAKAIAETDPTRVTHIFEEKPWQVGELGRQARALAANLEDHGLVAGDVVSFQLPNWYEAVVIDLAACMLGLVVAPIVPIYRDAEAAYMLADSRVKLAFYPERYRGYDYAAMMERLKPNLPNLSHSVIVRPSADRAETSFDTLCAGNRTPLAPAVSDPNSIKLILYTSGTTGRPKGVLHSHNSIACAVQSAVSYWGIREGETTLMPSPVTHITGFASGLELPFLCGTRTVFMDRWNASDAIALIEREQAVLSVGATPFLQELLTEAERLGRTLPSLRIYVCGGASVPPALIRKAQQVLLNCRAVRVYGSSEVPYTTLGFLASDQLEQAAETDGQCIYYDVRIKNDDGQILETGNEGEIWARGPAMFLGYADPDQTSESFDADGFFATGDLGFLSTDRAITITGRSKDLINRGGEKVSAKEIEDVLHGHPSVEEAAVVAMPHDRLGESVCAYVSLKPASEFTFANMIKHVETAGIAKQKYPEKLVITEGFPRTASGKIRKDVLRADINERLKHGVLIPLISKD